MDEIKSALEGPPGYLTGLSFRPEELALVRERIRAQWLERIGEVSPEARAKFEQLPMNRYHELCHLVDHKALWPKPRRILRPEVVEEIRATSLLKTFEGEFGSFVISDEEDLGYEEMYWRLVRPNSASDVGPLHADAWFWELGHGLAPGGHQRVKVWISIYCETGKNGLRFVPGSHKRSWRYHGEHRDGFVKPVFDEEEKDLDIHMFDSQAGDAIVFHDRLLHGGAPGGGTTRVSLEFTMFVRNERYFT